jgi:hypothetical protein
LCLEIPQQRLAVQRQRFLLFLAQLQSCPVPQAAMAPLACTVLGFKAPRLSASVNDPARVASDQARQQAWASLAQTVAQTSRRYADEMGDNAYAVLNTVTELATRPPTSPLVHRDRHGLQRRAGQWVAEFAAACGTPGFDLQTYLQSLSRQARTPVIHHDRGERLERVAAALGA